MKCWRFYAFWFVAIELVDVFGSIEDHITSEFDGSEEDIEWKPMCEFSGSLLPDCSCRVDTVDKTVQRFISPLLSNLKRGLNHILLFTFLIQEQRNLGLFFDTSTLI